MPLTSELSLLDTITDPTNNYCTTNEVTSAHPCQLWSIQNVQAKFDLITLDSGLSDSYVKLLEIRTRTINC